MTTELTKIDFSDNAKVVLERRYLSEGETPEDRMWAMCLYVASAEGYYGNDSIKRNEFVTKWASRFYDELIVTKKFFPNSPTIVNAGSQSKKGGLQACNVISPQDTMESIYQTVKDWALTEKFGAGIGAYFGDIRAKGSPINTTHGKALGPISVMKILSESSKHITQGSFREGAHMAILPIAHADILEFIHCKDECKSPDDVLHNFNISIQIPDSFMEDLVKGVDNGLGTVQNLWKEICESAWKTGDPGLFFIDRIRETEPNPQLGLIQAPNPCGEQPLENFNSCNLGSINLGKFVFSNIDIEEIDRDVFIDWDSLKETIHLAIRFLDDVIDVNIFPEDVPQLSEMNQKTRRVGLGVMGWHDMLVKLDIPYQSDEAIKLAEKISGFLTQSAWDASVDLAEEKGEFPEWKNSKIGINGNKPTRNSCVTTVAPTGTLNILAGCSSGIEPYYSLYTERKTLWSQGKSQATIVEIPDALKEQILSKSSSTVDWSENNIREILFNKGDTELFKTALEISPEWHIKHQASWQKHITNGISKTINLPNHATVEDISNAYIQAWKLGCKGATIYRDGCKDVQVLSSSNGLSFIEGKVSYPEIKIQPIDRPQALQGDTTEIGTGHGKAFVTVNSINGTPIEVFCNIGTAGKCDSANTSAITKLVSLCLRSQIDPAQVVKHLRNITCCPQWDKGFHIMSVPDAISKVLHDHINQTGLTSQNIEVMIDNIKSNNIHDQDILCPQCNGTCEFSEGCMKCSSCGWNKCG